MHESERVYSESLAHKFFINKDLACFTSLDSGAFIQLQSVAPHPTICLLNEKTDHNWYQLLFVSSICLHLSIVNQKFSCSKHYLYTNKFIFLKLVIQLFTNLIIEWYSVRTTNNIPITFFKPRSSKRIWSIWLSIIILLASFQPIPALIDERELHRYSILRYASKQNSNDSDDRENLPTNQKYQENTQKGPRNPTKEDNNSLPFLSYNSNDYSSNVDSFLMEHDYLYDENYPFLIFDESQNAIVSEDFLLPRDTVAATNNVLEYNIPIHGMLGDDPTTGRFHDFHKETTHKRYCTLTNKIGETLLILNGNITSTTDAFFDDDVPADAILVIKKADDDCCVTIYGVKSQLYISFNLQTNLFTTSEYPNSLTYLHEFSQKERGFEYFGYYYKTDDEKRTEYAIRLHYKKFLKDNTVKLDRPGKRHLRRAIKFEKRKLSDQKAEAILTKT